MHLLAQIAPESAPGIVTWILSASGAMFLINQALTFYKDHIRETPAPANTYATRADMDAELGRERSSRKKMHEEMTQVQKDITGLKTETHNQSNDIHAIKTDLKAANERIDKVPERTINLLRSTKGLIE